LQTVQETYGELSGAARGVQCQNITNADEQVSFSMLVRRCMESHSGYTLKIPVSHPIVRPEQISATWRRDRRIEWWVNGPCVFSQLSTATCRRSAWLVCQGSECDSEKRLRRNERGFSSDVESPVLTQ